MYLISLFVLIASLILAIILYRCQDYNLFDFTDQSKQEQTIILAWNRTIRSPANAFRKLVVGVNSNVDLIVPGVDLLLALNVTPSDLKNNDQLFDLQHLQETFYHFFQKGSAAERSFMDAELYKVIVKAARSLKDSQFYIGGNAALMASKIATEYPEVKIHFIGPVGPKLKNLFPSSIHIPEISHIHADEVHLIMEYQIGDTWGEHRAPVASRFITSYDESNSKMTMIKPYFDYIRPFKPDLVILSGLHLLDGQPTEFFTEQLDVIKKELQKIPFTIPVHLELASMGNKVFVKDILFQVVSHISSLGLNEQELTFLSHAADGPHSKYFENMKGQPEIYIISDILQWILETFGYSENNPSSKLTRIHFHSLTYHIIGVNPKAWKNSASAAGAGTQIAGVQACDLDSPDPNSVNLRIPNKIKLFSGDEERTFNPNSPIITWQKGKFDFAFSPVLVCKNPLKTVGLGDSISGTGLMYSEYTPNFQS